MIALLASTLAFCLGYVAGVVSRRRSSRYGRLMVSVGTDGVEGPVMAVSEDGTVRMVIVERAQP